MDFYMHHGRTDPDGPPEKRVQTPEGIEYHAVDDWGFNGPRLEGVTGFHCTYGVEGEWNLYFESDRAADAAQQLTGWHRAYDNALTVAFSEDNALLKITPTDEQRTHYFGDWGIR